MSFRWFIAGGLLLAVMLAVLVSPFASSSPDGLERVAIDHGFAERAGEPAWDHAPASDYAVPGVRHERLSTAAAGILGTALTFAACWIFFRIISRRSPADKVSGERS